MASTAPYTAAQRGSILSQLAPFVSQVDAINTALNNAKSLWSFSNDADITIASATTEMNNALDAAKTALKTGVYSGRILNPEDLAKLMQRLVDGLRKLSLAVKQFNATSPSAMLTGILQSITTLISDIVTFLGGSISRFKTLGNVILWGGVALAAIFVLPPILRTVLAYRKGGTDAALEAGASSLESGRDRIKSGAATATKGAVRAGAAYASGGASEAALRMQGLRGNRRRRARVQR
jgi:hypothetical protein